MIYRYQANLDPRERFDRLRILLDNGRVGTIAMGLAYDLTVAELARARQYVVLNLDPGPAYDIEVGGLVSSGGGGGAIAVTISGTPAVGQTLHCVAPTGAGFQWKRASTNIPSAVAADYTVTSLDQGKDVTCVASIPSNVLTVPGAPLTIEFAGDSFAGSLTDGLTDIHNNFAYLTATALGAAIANYAQGGARNVLKSPAGSNQIPVQVYQKDGAHELPASAPYAASYPIAVVQASINNLTLNAIVADLSIVTDSVKRSIHHLRAGGNYLALNTARWSYTGTWADIITQDANSGTGVKRSTANGSTATLTTPSDFPGGTLRVYGPKLKGFGAIFSFTVDGSNAGTLDVTNATLETGDGSQTWEKELTVAAGVHTIVLTVGSLTNGVVNINGADFDAPSPPLVIVMGATRAPNYPGGEHAVTNQNVLDMNTAVQSMLTASFPSNPKVIYFNMDAILAPGGVPQSAGAHVFFGPDDIHPNEVGAAAIANTATIGLVAKIQAAS
jgi:hypothetical protein